MTATDTFKCIWKNNANGLWSSQNGAQYVVFSRWQNPSQLKAGLLWCYKIDHNFAKSFSPTNTTLNMLFNVSTLWLLRLLQSFLQLFLCLLAQLMKGYMTLNHISNMLMGNWIIQPQKQKQTNKNPPHTSQKRCWEKERPLTIQMQSEMFHLRKRGRFFLKVWEEWRRYDTLLKPKSRN